MEVELILLGFLECQQCHSSEYQTALESLASTILPDEDGVLESDGLQPSKHRAATLEVDGGELNDADVEICRKIGAELAALGDQFEREGFKIDQKLVETLTEEILRQTLTEERFQATVKSLLSSVPAGIEQEKASLVVAMKLTSVVADHVPNLMQSCFGTATRYIRGHLATYVQCLTRQR